MRAAPSERVDFSGQGQLEMMTERERTKRERAEHRFWTLGTQYYIAGRSAVSFQLVAIYGNIYHHAIEMLLKAELVRIISPDDLQKKYGHHLDKLWPVFKGQRAELDRFDRTIAELDHFEKIRYPDHVLKHGATIQVTPDAATQGVEEAAINKESHYGVNKHNIDHFVLAIFRASGVNPAGYFSQLASVPHTRKMIMDDNPVADQLSPPR